MANKRQLKKYIRNTCGSLAAEILLAREAFPEIERKKVHDIIRQIAALQSVSLSKVSIALGGNSGAGERKAAYSRMMEDFHTAILAVVKEMNAALPENVRLAIKNLASK